MQQNTSDCNTKHGVLLVRSTGGSSTKQVQGDNCYLKIFGSTTSTRTVYMSGSYVGSVFVHEGRQLNCIHEKCASQEQVGI